ncbi:hypothetical protein C8241_04060 [Paracidovorax avenae]|uniref:hypothetical protein n=1 Tax=Paracidovorax avenae TaxID=80867 RepID=UPI000D17BF7A|nr:hypothetical protein [Paracidovorax avenae]AVS60989.1 hypothetical protein C8241_04060 [Paracidovorax avenae]
MLEPRSQGAQQVAAGLAPSGGLDVRKAHPGQPLALRRRKVPKSRTFPAFRAFRDGRRGSGGTGGSRRMRLQTRQQRFAQDVRHARIDTAQQQALHLRLPGGVAIRHDPLHEIRLFRVGKFAQLQRHALQGLPLGPRP